MCSMKSEDDVYEINLFSVSISIFDRNMRLVIEPEQGTGGLFLLKIFLETSRFEKIILSTGFLLTGNKIFIYSYEDIN